MPIYDQSFRHYDGPRTYSTLWWPVAREVLRPIIKAKFTWFVGIGIILQTAGIGIALYGLAKALSVGGAGGAEITRALRGSNLPIDQDLGLNTLLFRYLQWNRLLMMLAVLTGAGCIALDKKHQALPLYFSRPLSPRDYLAGKVLGLALLPTVFFAASILVIGIVAAALFYTELGTLLGEIPPMLGALFMVPVTLLLMALSLAAFSGATVKPNAAAFMFIAFWFLTQGLTQAGAAITRNEAFGALAPGHALHMVARFLIKPDPQNLARDREMLEFDTSLAVISIIAWFAIFLFFARRNLRTVEIVK